MANKILRKIIKIDEQKCDGCGLCAEACHEGAIQIIDGKARLISESYCDGLGDCIGECPQGAISFEEREVAPYDEEAVKAHIAKNAGCSGGCPGSMAQSMKGNQTSEEREDSISEPLATSKLGNWPVQLKLVPENAPYLSGSDLVIAADCTAFAHPDFHRTFLGNRDRVCLVGCPKLDDADFYMEKLARIIESNSPESLTVVYMEVPCCGKMVRLVESAIEKARVDLDYTRVQIALQGTELLRQKTRYRFTQ